MQRRPPLRDRDVELATALGSCPTLLLWRTRLPTIRVERVRRCVRGRGFLPDTWWEVALAAAGSAMPEQQRALIGEIQEANARLNRVVGNLLDVARLESGQVRPRLDWHDARDLVQTTLRELQRELAALRAILTQITALEYGWNSEDEVTPHIAWHAWRDLMAEAEAVLKPRPEAQP